MIPSVSWIDKNFDKFNKMYFGGELVKPALGVSRRSTAFGHIKWKYERGSNVLKFNPATGRNHRVGTVIPSSVKICISCFYDIPEHEIEETLIHEMIHLKMVQDGFPEEHHGARFRKMAREISAKGKHQINVTDPCPYKVSSAIKKKSMRVYFLRDVIKKKFLYMTCKPELSKVTKVREACKKYSYLEFIGECVSNHDCFQGKNSTITATGWRARYFRSTNEYNEVWKSGKNKRTYKTAA